MFTRNYKSWIRNSMLYSSGNGFYDVGNTVFTEQRGTISNSNYGSWSLRTSDLGTCMKRLLFSAPTTSETSAAGYCNGIMLGTGTTPPTENDYNLENPILSGISFVAGSVVIAPAGDGSYVMYVDHVLTNKTEEDITINEVGLFGEVCSRWSSNTNWGIRAVLLERTVLGEPFVIPAGKLRLFTYKLTFNQT